MPNVYPEAALSPMDLAFATRALRSRNYKLFFA